ncbi:hypothetical protein J3F83DRAFT_769962 [Trichoderma novae-zelandiae]
METQRDRDDSSVEESDPFLGASIRSKEESQSQRRRPDVLLYTLIVLLGVSLGSHVLTYLHIHRASYLDAACVRHTQQNPTPIDIPIHYHSVLYDGTFLANSTSVFRLPPSPEVDAAWEGLGTTSKPLVLSRPQAIRAGISPDHLKTPSGDFPVLFEFNHHLHCLNMIRKAVFFNYDYYSSPDFPGHHLGKDEETISKHVTHCIDMLRQVIQCKPDLGVFGQYWVKDAAQGVDGSFVDFNTNHKCVDWEPVREWVRAHQTLEDMVVELQEGDKILDIAP